MIDKKDLQERLDKYAFLRDQMARQFSADAIENPRLADAILKQMEEMVQKLELEEAAMPAPPDGGLAELAGIGPGAAKDLGQTKVAPPVKPYDENILSERMGAVADLYYIYQHDKIGVFRVVQKLKELFHAGAVRLSEGDGAYQLYQFDRREVLRYTLRERYAAYRRAFGYGAASLMPGGTPNVDFHHLFSHFNNQVALFWRDKRISDVVRDRAYDPSFGSIAIVRRAGLDLRNNLKFTSYGHINVMRVELLQLLNDAFAILGSEDVKALFGADHAWDVVEEVLVRYFNERLVTSPRQRMAVQGRRILQWLSHDHINEEQRGAFETLLLEVAEPAEEWLTSAQSLGLTRRIGANRVLGANGSWPAASGQPALRRPVRSNGRQTRQREFEDKP
jgi:hypothetical protein